MVAAETASDPPTSVGGPAACPVPIVKQGQDPQIYLRADPSCSVLLVGGMGEVRYLEDANCFVFFRKDIDPHAVAVWPADTRPVREGDRLGVIVDGKRVFSGDTVVGAIFPDVASGVPDLDPRCAGQRDAVGDHGATVHIDKSAAFIQKVESVIPGEPPAASTDTNSN